MRFKSIMKKCLWVMLVILISVLMIGKGQAALYDAALPWEILKGIAAILPVWLLSLLGLARSFFGENWFPFAEKIPVRIINYTLAQNDGSIGELSWVISVPLQSDPGTAGGAYWGGF